MIRMGSSLSATLLCLILIILFHGSFGSTDGAEENEDKETIGSTDGAEENEDKETNASEQELADRLKALQIRKAVFLRRAEILENTRKAIDDFMEAYKNEMTNLENPAWSDPYREFVINELLATLEIVESEQKNKSYKQVWYSLKDAPHLDYNDLSLRGPINSADENVRKLTKYTNDIKEIKNSLRTMIKKIQKTKASLPAGSEPMSDDQYNDELLAIQEILKNLMRMKKEFRSNIVGSSSEDTASSFLEDEVFDLRKKLEEFRKLVVKSKSSSSKCNPRRKSKGKSKP